MLWVVLVLAGAVTAYVVVGVLADRRMALPTPADGSAAGPAALPPPSPPPAAPILRGDTAATAVKVPAAWRSKLAAGTCACGEPLALASDEAIRFDGRLLVVVRLACAACGHARSVYLEPAAA
ncbi:MAG: hypothetical protein IPL61_05340 [Myxococcales bacterium]|nr:hypothetical protein [Myxococcales bacterium]